MSEINDSTFDARVERRDEMTVVQAMGEIDVATAPALEERLIEASEESTGLLVIDLSAVSLIDSTGLGVLINLRERLEGLPSPKDLRLVVARPQIRKVFAITGLDSVFSIFPTLETAAALAG